MRHFDINSNVDFRDLNGDIIVAVQVGNIFHVRVTEVSNDHFAAPVWRDFYCNNLRIKLEQDNYLLCCTLLNNRNGYFWEGQQSEVLLDPIEVERWIRSRAVSVSNEVPMEVC